MDFKIQHFDGHKYNHELVNDKPITKQSVVSIMLYQFPCLNNCLNTMLLIYV